MHDFMPLLWSSKWCSNAKMYDLLTVAFSEVAPIKMYDFCRCFGFSVKMYDLLPLLWPRSGAPMLRCTICCRCFGLCSNAKRFVAVAVVSKYFPNAKMYDLLPLLWSRSGAPMLRCTICCRCFGLEVSASMLRCTICCCCFGFEVVPPNAKMYDLLPLLWFRSGAPMLRCTICCRCFGLEVMPQC